jgi:hypothetical protein
MVHSWVGGSLRAGVRPAIRGTMVLSTSPNDDLFLHHANIDRLGRRGGNGAPEQACEPAKSGGKQCRQCNGSIRRRQPATGRDISDLGYRYR